MRRGAGTGFSEQARASEDAGQWAASRAPEGVCLTACQLRPSVREPSPPHLRRSHALRACAVQRSPGNGRHMSTGGFGSFQLLEFRLTESVLRFIRHRPVPGCRLAESPLCFLYGGTIWPRGEPCRDSRAGHASWMSGKQQRTSATPCGPRDPGAGCHYARPGQRPGRDATPPARSVIDGGRQKRFLNGLLTRHWALRKMAWYSDNLGVFGEGIAAAKRLNVLKYLWVPNIKYLGYLW